MFLFTLLVLSTVTELQLVHYINMSLSEAMIKHVSVQTAYFNSY